MDCACKIDIALYLRHAPTLCLHDREFVTSPHFDALIYTYMYIVSSGF